MGLEPPKLATNGFSNPGFPEISRKEHPCSCETKPSHHHEETVQSHQDVRLGPTHTNIGKEDFIGASQFVFIVVAGKTTVSTPSQQEDHLN